MSKNKLNHCFPLLLSFLTACSMPSENFSGQTQLPNQPVVNQPVVEGRNSPSAKPVLERDISSSTNAKATTRVAGRILTQTDGATAAGKVSLVNKTSDFSQSVTVNQGVYTFETVPEGMSFDLIFEQDNGFRQRRAVSTKVETLPDGENAHSMDFHWIPEAKLGGYIYDLDGYLVDDVLVEIHTVDEAVSFSDQTLTREGAYYFADVPENVDLELVISKAGYNSDFAEKLPVNLSLQANHDQKEQMFLGHSDVFLMNFGHPEKPPFSLVNPESYRSFPGLRKSETDYFLGVVYDVDGQPVPDAKVSYRITSPEYLASYDETRTNANGQYLFMQGTTGVQIEMVVEKVGYVTQKRTEVLVSGAAGNPLAHIYDFGLPTPSREFEPQNPFALRKAKVD